MEEQERKEKRLEVVKDALVQLRRGKYNATPSKVVQPVTECLRRETGTTSSARESINGALQKDGVTCNVCARGSLLISVVRKVKDMPCYKVLDAEGSHDGCNEKNSYERDLEEIFDSKQLALMEIAFELHPGMNPLTLNSSERKDAIAFGRSTFTPSPYERLVKIFENVVQNDGTFIP